MNILTFDIEEWYLEKINDGGREEKYRQFDEMLARLLDTLDENNIKATFFCVGKLATDFPSVVKKIDERGHEVGCHSNVHTWLNRMTEIEFRKDTEEAIKSLEDLTGKKITSYRAPSFTITQGNKWAVNILAECGITTDSSIFPTNRDFGGYKNFPQDIPCMLSYEGSTLKEFPIGQTSILGKSIAYSGGGYFRMLPYTIINKVINDRDYNICYFHLADLINEQRRMLSRTEHEQYYKEPGTLKNRLVRHAKNNIGFGNTFSKMNKLLKSSCFINLRDCEDLIDWKTVNIILL